MLPTGYRELNAHQGAVALSMIDALRGRAISLPIDVTVERPRDVRISARSARGAALFYGDRVRPTAAGAPIPTAVLRVADPSRQFVPRRVVVHLAEPPPDQPARRVRPVHLFPGAAWPFSAHGATGIRGRVVDAAGRPRRWTRVEARMDGEIVGIAHGDDRGEFLLLLWPRAGQLADSGTQITARLRIFTLSPTPAASTWVDDPLADLPLEAIDLEAGGPTPLAQGIGRPPGYGATPATQSNFQFAVGRVRSDGATFVV